MEGVLWNAIGDRACMTWPFRYTKYPDSKSRPISIWHAALSRNAPYYVRLSCFQSFLNIPHFCCIGRQHQDGSQKSCGNGIVILNTRFLSLSNLNLYYIKFILFFAFITFLWSSEAPRLFFSICDIIGRLFPIIFSFHYLLYLKFKNKRSFN